MSSDDPSQPDPLRTERRTFLSAITGLLGALLNIVPLSLGGLFFLDPLIRRRQAASAGDGSDTEGFVRLSVDVDSVPTDGTPMAVTVVADQTDAWNLYQNVPIGSIWLRRLPDGKFAAFNSTCPHLGCAVDYRAANNDFYCPCHTSAFDLDGEKRNEIPPRSMDSLEIFKATRGKRDDAGTELWVKYQEFRGGTDQKVEV